MGLPLTNFYTQITAIPTLTRNLLNLVSIPTLAPFAV